MNSHSRDKKIYYIAFGVVVIFVVAFAVLVVVSESINTSHPNAEAETLTSHSSKQKLLNSSASFPKVETSEPSTLAAEHSVDVTNFHSFEEESPNLAPDPLDSSTPKSPEIPLVFEHGELIQKLALERPSVLLNISEEFASTLTSSGISPYDPRYSELWNEAVQKANDSFRQEFGYDAIQSIFYDRKGANP
jgi:hypothetical protein